MSGQLKTEAVMICCGPNTNITKAQSTMVAIGLCIYWWLVAGAGGSVFSLIRRSGRAGRSNTNGFGLELADFPERFFVSVTFDISKHKYTPIMYCSATL